MILARGSTKILRVGAVRLRQQHNFEDVDEAGFYDAMGDMGEADGGFLGGDALMLRRTGALGTETHPSLLLFYH
jgi:hypothetical protein